MAGAQARDVLVGSTVPGEVDHSLVRELEGLAHRAWPPLRERTLGGWVLRESAGSSRRGNSVWAAGPVDDLAEALDEVLAFYGRAGLPATFQITPASRPEGLSRLLDRAGFDDSGPTDVCVATLDGLLDRLDGWLPGLPGPAFGRLELAKAADDRWLAVAGTVLSTFGTGQRAGTLAALDRLAGHRQALPSVYATVVADGMPVAVGRAVADGDWVGIYSMATVPAARGRGAAATVLAGLGEWAATEAGAGRAYLQVEESSGAARRQYARFGFRPVYRYSYRRAR